MALVCCTPDSDLPPLPPGIEGDVSEAVRLQLDASYEAARNNPANPDAVGALGMVLHTYEFYAEAEQCYLRTRALAPNDARWHYYLAILFELSGRRDEAIEAAGRAVRFAPGNTAAHLLRARLLVSTGRTSEARRLYEEMLERDPGSIPAMHGIGRALDAAGDALNAATWLEKAVAADRQYGAAHYALALVYRKLGHVPAAERHFAYYRIYKGLEPAVEDPWLEDLAKLDRSARGHVTRAEQYVMRGRTAEAVAEYLAAAQIEPDNVAIQDSLIGVYWELGDYEEAIRHYHQALAITSKSAKTHFNYGLVLFSSNELKEAVSHYRRALEINPRDANAHHQLGLTYERLGNLQSAERHYRIALQNAPNHRQVHFLLGRLLAKRNDYAEAIRHLKQTTKTPDNRTPWFLRALAGVQAQAGRPELALELTQQAQALAGGFGDSELLAHLNRERATYQRQVDER